MVLVIVVYRGDGRTHSKQLHHYHLACKLRLAVAGCLVAFPPRLRRAVAIGYCTSLDVIYGARADCPESRVNPKRVNVVQFTHVGVVDVCFKTAVLSVRRVAVA